MLSAKYLLQHKLLFAECRGFNLHLVPQYLASEWPVPGFVQEETFFLTPSSSQKGFFSGLFIPVWDREKSLTLDHARPFAPGSNKSKERTPILITRSLNSIIQTPSFSSFALGNEIRQDYVQQAVKNEQLVMRVYDYICLLLATLLHCL